MSIGQQAAKIFEETMSSLEISLQVRHIATFEIKDCQFDDEADAVFELDPEEEFSQFPVRKDGRIVGVLERSSSRTGRTAEERMCPLDETLLVSAGWPLEKFISHMRSGPFYRLVLEGPRINGIVTRSDLLKLPVRLLAFARIAHLESIMAGLIQTQYPDDQVWLSLLPNGQQHGILKLRDKLRDDPKDDQKQEGVDPPLVELTSLKQKGLILSKTKTLVQVYNLDENFIANIEEIYELRNKVAHVGDYAPDRAKLNAFLEILEIVDDLIRRLEHPL